MALISCPGCGRQISEYARTCPGCGFALIPSRSAEPAEFPPSWPDDYRVVLPWAALYAGLAAALACLILWRRQLTDAPLWWCWSAQILLALAVSGNLAGAVFRSLAVLLGSALCYLAAAGCAFAGRLTASALIALPAAMVLAVFLLLELIRLHRKKVP